MKYIDYHGFCRKSWNMNTEVGYINVSYTNERPQDHCKQVFTIATTVLFIQNQLLKCAINIHAISYAKETK